MVAANGGGVTMPNGSVMQPMFFQAQPGPDGKMVMPQLFYTGDAAAMQQVFISAPQLYVPGERKRVRSACMNCHERKLRCVMLPSGSCQQCTEKDRVCLPRVEKKRGRPRASGSGGKPEVDAQPLSPATAAVALTSVEDDHTGFATSAEANAPVAPAHR